MPKTPFPPGIPGHLTGFLLLKVGDLTLPGLLGRHLTFMSKRRSASQVKGSHHSFIQRVHCVHGSLLLYYSFISWSIWEPLKKPVECGLSGINKWGIWPKMRHSRSGIWLLSQNADQHHNWKDLAGGLFYHFNCQHIYWGIWPKVFDKVKCPGVCRAGGKGGGGHRQLNIDIEWYMLFYLQWLQKLQVDNNIKYIEVDADFLNII